jgi:hypothetical protein
MSQAIKGAAMLAGAVGMGVAAFLDPALIASPMFDKLLIGLVVGGISMEAGALASSLMTHRGVGITTRQTAAYRQRIRGEQRVPGVILYESTTGGHHDQFNYIIVLDGHVSDSIVNLYLDGRQVFFTGSGPGWSVRNGVGFGGAAGGGTKIGPGGAHYNFDTLVYCEARWGEQLDGDVMASMTANDPNWAADGLGNSPWCGGCTYVYLKVEHDTAMFPNAPEIRFTVRGKNDIWDPRTGTRGYSTNWALHIADVLTDLQELGDVGAVNQAQLIAAANVCDEQVAIAIGGTESRYCLHWHYDTAVAPGDVLQTMMPAAAGRISRVGAEWFIWPAYWQGPSFSFDESVFSGAVEWTPYRGMRELVNRVNGTYIAPNSPWNVAGNLYDSNGWYNGSIANQFPFAFQPTNYPQYAQDVLHGYANDKWLEEDSGVLGAWNILQTYALGDAVTDGGVIYRSLQDANLGNDPTAVDSAWWGLWSNQLPLEVTQNCCLSIAQAQRVAKIYLLRNREQGSGTFLMHLEAWQMQPTDVMALTFLINGWAGKLLEVTQTKFTVEEDDKGVRTVKFQVMAQETDQSVYEWNTSEELSVYDVPSNPTTAPYLIDPPSNLVLLSSNSTAVIGADGVVTPRILATWVPPPDARVTQIQVQYEVHGSGIWLDAGAVDVATTSDYIAGVIVGTTYDVRIRSLANNGATSVWVETDNVTVVAPNSLQSTYTIDSGTIAGPYVLSQPSATEIDLAACTCSFGGLPPVNYSARTFTIPAPTAETAYYVTIADPTQQGESAPTLAATCQTSDALVGVQGHTYMGAILAEPNGGSIYVGPGGWPVPPSFQVGP